MAYQIRYDASIVKKRRLFRFSLFKIKKQQLLVGICILLSFMLIAVCVIPQFRLYLRDLILPGDPAVTASALEEMVEAIGAGESLQSALTEFCKSILSGA